MNKIEINFQFISTAPRSRGTNVIKNQLSLSFGKICKAINYTYIDWKMFKGTNLDDNHFSCTTSILLV